MGTSGAVVHWTGTWSAVPSSTSINLNGIGGIGPNSVWATDDSGGILTWNGALWSPKQSGARRYLYGVWGTGANAWAVGGGGGIAEYTP